MIPQPNFRVAVDMDGVLVDLMSYFVQEVNARLGTSYTHDDLTSFNIHEALPKVDKHLVAEIMESPGMFGADRQPLEGAINGLQKLNELYDVMIVTSPWHSSRHCEQDKRDWIRKHAPFIKQSQISMMNHKTWIDAHVLIDDKPKTIIDYTMRDKDIIAFAQPWNASLEEDGLGDLRCATWPEVISRVESLAAQDNWNKSSINRLRDAFHETACQKGWWDEDKNDGECIALMHSELSEALEALRQGNPKSDVIPTCSVGEELADTVIRILDYCGARGIDIDTAVRAKAAYNKMRSHKHGGKKF